MARQRSCMGKNHLPNSISEDGGVIAYAILGYSSDVCYIHSEH